MGSKNTAFTRPDAPVSADPVAELQAAADAAATQEQPSGFEALVVDQGIVESPSEQPEQQEVADVQDTTVQQPPVQEPLPVARVEPRRQDNRAVARPSGGRARETSPQGVNQDVQQTSNSFAALITKEKIQGTANSIHLIQFLEGYVIQMAPGRITRPSVILQQQESLFDEIMYILNRAPAQEFKRLWNLLVVFVREYSNGAFSPTYYSRGAKEWRRSPAQYHNLTLMMNLLQATAADPATVTQQVNVNSIVESGYSEDARGRLIGFYVK